MSHKNHYGILQVSEDASAEVIKAAYKALAQKLHPDRNSSSDATQQFQRVSEAYRVLVDTELRSEYDEALRQQRSSRTHQAESAPSTQSQRRGHTSGQPSEFPGTGYGAASPPEVIEARSKALRSLAWGSLILIVGLGVSLATYLDTSEKGGRYVVFWGAVVFGGIKVLISVINLSRLRAQPLAGSSIWATGVIAVIMMMLAGVIAVIMTMPFWVSVDSGQDDKPLPFASTPADNSSEVSPDVRDALRSVTSSIGASPPRPSFSTRDDELRYIFWQLIASVELRTHIQNDRVRDEFLETVWYESYRAGLQPHLVLAYIHEASGFRQYAIESNGARGYMQVLPFVSRLIGDDDSNRLFHVQMNLRFGCILLRDELDKSSGNILVAVTNYAQKYSGKTDPQGFASMVLTRSESWKLLGL